MSTANHHRHHLHHHHGSAAFNHSCLRAPRNPLNNKQPLNTFEQDVYVRELEDRVRDLNLNAKNSKEVHQLKVKQLKDMSIMSDDDSFRKFIDFFDSIPNYEDVNHLSNRDFYQKLDHIKRKQRSYYDYLETDQKNSSRDRNDVRNRSRNRNRSRKQDYKNSNNDSLEDDEEADNIIKSALVATAGKKSSLKPYFCTSTAAIANDSAATSSREDVQHQKPPSRRSVRIESPSDSQSESHRGRFRPKSRANLSSSANSTSSNINLNGGGRKSGHNNNNNSNIDNKGTFCDDEITTSWDGAGLGFRNVANRPATPFVTRSAPNSPSKTSKSPQQQSIGWKDTITIPKPFQMTVRDEENQIIDEILAGDNVKLTGKPDEKSLEIFKANPVPIESKIPLFDKIMVDQERRRQKVKKKSKATLMAQMRPFSFTQKEEELQNLSRRLSRSTPSLYWDDRSDPNSGRNANFRAKPVPKNLFSNYVYKKMHENEFYRALQKKIRAEEMLRQASLPPSMAKREKCKIKTAICARAMNNFRYNANETTASSSPTLSAKRRKHNRTANKKDKDVNNGRLENCIEEFMKDYLSYNISSSPPATQTFKRGKKKTRRIKSSSSTASRTNTNTITDSNRNDSAMSFDYLTRSNLAAVLRAQNARKRLAHDMYKRLEEAKFREQSRWKEKLFRKKPVWEVLAYSHEEDLAMRLQMRRDEERLRHQEHRERMHSMLDRVNGQPTLFERQSEFGQKKRDSSSNHHHREHGGRRRRHSVDSSCKYSDLSVFDGGKEEAKKNVDGDDDDEDDGDGEEYQDDYEEEDEDDEVEEDIVNAD